MYFIPLSSLTAEVTPSFILLAIQGSKVVTYGNNYYHMFNEIINKCTSCMATRSMFPRASSPKVNYHNNFCFFLVKKKEVFNAFLYSSFYELLGGG